MVFLSGSDAYKKKINQISSDRKGKNAPFHPEINSSLSFPLWFFSFLEMSSFSGANLKKVFEHIGQDRVNVLMTGEYAIYF